MDFLVHVQKVMVLNQMDARAKVCVEIELTIHPNITACILSELNESELPPSEGSCIEAGYNSSDICCVSGFCAGIPAVCLCDLECYERGDCCSDIDDSCTEG